MSDGTAVSSNTQHSSNKPAGLK